MDANQQKIKEHYDNTKEVSRSRRRMLETINIRNMNNFIKSVLISENVPASGSILDIGCGKGGDLTKFGTKGILDYVGIDISEKCVQLARKRHRDSPLKFRASFLVLDAYNTAFDLNKRFDVVSVQFSLHYAFASQESLRTSLQNIAAHLKDGGKLIATVPNSETLLRRYSRHGNGYGNSFYSVVFEKPYESIMSQKNLLGTEYRFTLRDSLDDCVEYLVDIVLLEEECRRAGLVMIESTDFVSYFNRNARKYLSLHARMLPRKLNIEELKVCELYSVLVAEKRACHEDS